MFYRPVTTPELHTPDGGGPVNMRRVYTARSSRGITFRLATGSDSPDSRVAIAPPVTIAGLPC